MFLAIPRSSSGGKIVLLQHLVSSLSVSSYLVHRLRADIIILDMFRAIPCSSSGGQIVLLQHLVSSLSHSVHRLRADCSPLSTGALNSCLRRVPIPDAVIIQFDLLKMSMVLLETFRGL